MRAWIKSFVDRRALAHGVIHYEIYRKNPAGNPRRLAHPDMGPTTGRYPTPKMLAEWEDEVRRIMWDWEKELNARADEATVKIAVVTAAQQFVAWAANADYAASTIERFDLYLQRFCAWVQARWTTRHMGNLRTCDYVAYRNYLIECGLSAATINLNLYDLRTWNKWALGESYVHRNYARLCNTCKTGPGGIAHMAIKGAVEFWQMIERLKNHHQVAVTGLLACTGMRINELRWLRWDSSWDFYVDTLSIGNMMADTKTKKHGRIQPVPPITRRWLMMLKVSQDKDSPYVCGASRGWQRFSSQPGNWLRPIGITPKNLRQWFRSSLVTVARLNKMGDCTELINDMLGHMMKKVRSSYERNEDLEGSTPLMDRFSEWLLAAKETMESPPLR